MRHSTISSTSSAYCVEAESPEPQYAAGSQGPKEAELLLREGDHWRAI